MHVIDFRYHLVSLVAIFLALALGIVIGSAALNGQVSALTTLRGALETNAKDLRSQVVDDAAFAASVTATLVKGALRGERVLLVTTPDTPGSLVSAIKPVLVQAGAAMTGQLMLRPELADPARTNALQDLVVSVAPAGITLPGGAAVAQAAVELAAALLGPPGAPGLSAAAAEKVLGGFAELKAVELSRPSGPAQQATLAVFLIQPAGNPKDASQRALTATVLRVASAMDDRSEGVVVAGPADALGDGGILTALRADSGLSARVSSVDGADSPVGRILSVLALQEQAQGGSGRYGGGPGASVAVPSPSPR